MSNNRTPLAFITAITAAIACICLIIGFCLIYHHDKDGTIQPIETTIETTVESVSEFTTESQTQDAFSNASGIIKDNSRNTLSQSDIIEYPNLIEITIPIDLLKIYTKSDMNTQVNLYGFDTGIWNGDGTVTYYMTEEVNQTMLKQTIASIYSTAAEIVNEYDTIIGLSPDSDFLSASAAVKQGGILSKDEACEIADKIIPLLSLYGYYDGYNHTSPVVTFYDSTSKEIYNVTEDSIY